MQILIAGLSTRAIAESAARAGYQIVTVDYFGDRDQKRLVTNISLLRDLGCSFSAQALGKACEKQAADRVVPIANLENYPEIVGRLARGRILMGNPPPVLTRVRDWRLLRAACTEAAVAVPTTWLAGEEHQATPGQPWLVKPLRGGGGHNVRFWRGEPLGAGQLLQAYQPGRSASAVFVADGKQGCLLGLCEQLIGEEVLGVGGFNWCGNLFPLSLAAKERATIWREVAALVANLVRRFELRGVNGIDFVLGDDGRPYLVEVNPRYTASMELVERVTGLSIFELHLQAAAGRLPDIVLPGDAGTTYGKGIVFARRDVTIPETADWYARGRRDIPFPNDRIAAGQPICTLLVEGADRADCWQRLVTQADVLRREIGDEIGGLR